MKYSAKQYAVALWAALKDKPEPEHKKFMRNLLMLLAKNGDRSKLSSIIREMEKSYWEETGLKKVLLESSRPISKEIKKEIENILGKKIVIFEKIDQKLLSGIKILIDDMTLIDASAQSRIQKMFTNN